METNKPSPKTIVYTLIPKLLTRKSETGSLNSEQQSKSNPDNPQEHCKKTWKWSDDKIKQKWTAALGDPNVSRITDEEGETRIAKYSTTVISTGRELYHNKVMQETDEARIVFLLYPGINCCNYTSISVVRGSL